MLYPKDFEHKIDFSTIRQKLENYCSFELSRQKVDSLSFLTDYDAITSLLSTTQEMLNIVNDSSIDYPDGAKHDMREALQRIRIEGMYLDESQLAALLSTTSTILLQVRFFCSLDTLRFPYLSKIAINADTNAISTVNQAIDHLLDRYGKIRDNASPELSRIRQELVRSQGSVSRLLNQILRSAQAEGFLDSDASPTIREGRLVLPVSPQYKRKIGGIVHDESATGKTVYIEPQQVVEANNRIRELENEESREVIRILLDFAARLRPHIHAILDAEQLLADIDFIHAKALLARELNAIAPIVSRRCIIDWHEARHPVLYLNFKAQGKSVVPLDIRLNEQSRILVISGPNAGGKSVCLKTVAMLQYMMQCGLLVPLREDSTMGIFDKMMIDIGDSQSIDDDLSTYSSHLKNMRNFTLNADNRSLILIDEFGGGTEPLIGGAIAEAVLRTLNDKHVYGVITTHYTNLKHLAEEVAGITNGAMLYDRGKFQPLFQLTIGQAGSSFALEMAKQIGLDDNIIRHATDIIGSDKLNYDKHLQDIARDKRYWETKREKIHQQEKRLEERLAYYEGEIATLKHKQKEVLSEAKQQAQELLNQSNAAIENTIREIKESQAEKERTRKARQHIEKLKESMTLPGVETHVHGEADRKNASPFPSLERKGAGVGEKSTSLEKKEAGAGNKSTSKPKKPILHDFAELKTLTRNSQGVNILREQSLNAQRQAALQRSSVADEVRKRKLTFKDEIDLRGMRADEALQELMNYIDDAIMVGASEVRILHGTGTGALKHAIRSYLKTQHRIVDFHDGDPDKGGAGLTIVEL